ncbi:hypothetical protein N6L26_11780 [Qipengyuania sp. SS22]|uniref:hypothetical protein n=1 Tax=Qipengyuania sp. SS22 TaxID=2979461 RepID=UPI0021E5B875|nr:hypothetical protein [Qipengyuania sp. SS22]UYH54708.1 hypothetical protein N6L26_11780 [Qipengyuania sp. SS22]
MNERDDGAWFAPKSHGYGAGLPIAWQGWALLTGYLAVLLLCVGLAAWNAEVGLAGAILLGSVATAALVYVAALKTRGGWRWRWGKDD